MKHFYKLIFFCLLMPNIGLAQGNLVPNFSFEDTVSCPFATDDIDAASGWYNASGSPDYFHPCANSITPQNGVPQNTAGFQYPYNGEAYAGVITYATSSPNVREYIGILLHQPLAIGTEYFVSAFISKGDASSVAWNNDCATNNFGYRFSTSKYDEFVFTFAQPDNFSQIHSDDVITDSTNWVQISGSFIADSAYTYLRIGNFYDNSNTNITPCTGDAYYYVDAVCVSTDSLACEVTTTVNPTHTKSVLSVFPNPAQDLISVSNKQSVRNYSILDITGRQVKEGRISATNNFLNVSFLPNGMYYLRLEESGAVKFIISR